jgi:hypothetical protein
MTINAHHRMRRYRVLEGLRRISGLENATPKAPTPGETMEKIKPRLHMNNRSGQVRSGQVRSGQVILFLMKNITPPGTPGAVRKSGKMDRNGE